MGIRRRLARQRALVIVAAVVATLAVTAALPAAAGASTLTYRIVKALKAHGFTGSTTGVRVYNLSTATSLYERRSATQFLPASNEKLVTSSTALADWGADFHFKTELLTTGTVSTAGVYTGKLYLKGFGDPSLTTARLKDFVTALKNATIPVKKIVGNVVGDESYFDAARTVSYWKPDIIDDCGPLSALALNENYRSDGRRATDPPLFVAAQLTALLRKAGITVSGKATTGVTPSTAQVAYVEKSPALWHILASMNKPSDNFYAEMLTKGLGAQFAGGGTTARGVKAEGTFLVSIGFEREDLQPDRRLWAELLRSPDDGRHHQAARRHGAAHRLEGLLVLALGGRRRRHALGAHARHRRQGQPARQDRHADRREQPLGLREERQRRLARLLGAHEQARHQRLVGPCGPGRDRCRPGALAAGRQGRLVAQPGALI